MKEKNSQQKRLERSFQQLTSLLMTMQRRVKFGQRLKKNLRKRLQCSLIKKC
nr:MAG TPA: hypothetical protein [Caudoviricetes sp.]DAW73505.1 MAG TPA: hypothetical protein [Caudoviricetes sp.]